MPPRHFARLLSRLFWTRRCYLTRWISLHSGGPDSGTAFNWWLMDSELVRTGRDRLLRVFRYLEALNEHRNPVKRHLDQQLWTLWLKDLPDHPSVRRGTPPVMEPPSPPASDDGLSAQSQNPDFVLKIARPSGCARRVARSQLGRSVQRSSIP